MRVAGDDLYMVRATTEDASEKVGVHYRNRTVRIKKASLDVRFCCAPFLPTIDTRCESDIRSRRC